MSATGIDLKTVKLAWDKAANDWRRNTTGKIEFVYIERPSGRLRYKSTGCANIEDAQTFIRDLKGDLQDRRAEVVEATIGEIADLYEKVKGSRNSYVVKLKTIVCPRLGDRRFSSLTIVDLIDYETERRRKVGSGSIRNELGALKTLRTWAVGKKTLIPAEKVAALIDIERPAELETNRDALSEQEIERLWVIVTRYQPRESRRAQRLSRAARFGAIAIDTGMRKEAIATLKWKQVDFVNHCIHFDKYLDKPIPKNKQRPVSPMSPRLEAFLMIARQEATGPYVLDTPCGIDETFISALKGTEFEGRVFPHLLRHSFVTNMIARGNDIYFVAKIVGDDYKTLKNRYEHLQPDFLRDQIKWGPNQHGKVKLAVAAE